MALTLDGIESNTIYSIGNIQNATCVQNDFPCYRNKHYHPKRTDTDNNIVFFSICKTFENQCHNLYK